MAWKGWDRYGEPTIGQCLQWLLKLIYRAFKRFKLVNRTWWSQIIWLDFFVSPVQIRLKMNLCFTCGGQHFIQTSTNIYNDQFCNFITFSNIQLGQPSVIPPRLVLEVGGTSTLQAAMPVKLKSPPLQASKWGGTSALQAWLPAKLKSPLLQAQVWGGSRWADLAVQTSRLIMVSNPLEYKSRYKDYEISILLPTIELHKNYHL